MGRYSGIEILKDSSVKPGVRFYKTVRYPEIPLQESDIYVITSIGDRLDLLANQYYGDSSLYWIISIANESLPQDSLIVPEGTQLRIPQYPAQIISKYNALNSL